MRLRASLTGALMAGFLVCTLASAEQVKVTVTNLAPANGNFLTPTWVGFHNGTFDLYNPGEAVSPAFERLAEDGNNAPLMAAFMASGAGSLGATLGGAPLAPSSSISEVFSLDGMSPDSRYFSWASMVVPSNDAFVANGNPMAFQVFSSTGVFLGADFTVMGTMVNDAGSEVNDEIPANTAMFGQMVPNAGTPENGVVTIHPGFKPVGSGGILDDPMYAGADFKAPGYQIARVQVEAVPEPSTIFLSLTGLLAAAGAAKLRQKTS